MKMSSNAKSNKLGPLTSNVYLVAPTTHFSSNVASDGSSINVAQ